MTSTTPTPKKPYNSPKLRRYGDFRRLTRGKNASKRESGGTSGKKTRSGD